VEAFFAGFTAPDDFKPARAAVVTAVALMDTSRSVPNLLHFGQAGL
jgi:hypothetical protein